jgi:hypothetical protein
VPLLKFLMKKNYWHIWAFIALDSSIDLRNTMHNSALKFQILIYTQQLQKLKKIHGRGGEEKFMLCPLTSFSVDATE